MPDINNLSDLAVFTQQHLFLITVLLVWSLFWKGLALWQSVKHRRPWWFVVLLVTNTVGLLELVYLFLVEEKWWSNQQK